MNRGIRCHRKVHRDLADIFVYLGRTRVSSAHRFLREAEATFERLAGAPGIGARYEPDDPLFDDVRVFPVSRFKKYLVFYRPIEDGVEFLRILHGARDVQGLLAEGFDIADDDDDDDASAEKPDSP
jgi:toxin ParE1/3/4